MAKLLISQNGYEATKKLWIEKYGSDHGYDDELRFLGVVTSNLKDSDKKWNQYVNGRA